MVVCRNHRARLDSLIRGVRDSWVDLDLIAEAGSAPKDTAPKTRRSKSASPPAPANLDRLVLTDRRSSSVRFMHLLSDGKPADASTPVPSVLAVVASWVLLVAEERPLAASLPRSVVGQLDLLVVHHDWVAAQGWVADYWSEFTGLSRAIRGALRDRSSLTMGRCYLTDEIDVTPSCGCSCHAQPTFRPVCDQDGGCHDGHTEYRRCGGTLLRPNGAESVRCTRCHQTWVTPAELARLELALNSKETA